MNKYAIPLIQDDSSYTSTPIWNRGLHGEDEIIGQGDSGIDTTSCYFHDPTQAIPTDGSFNTQHRKILGYRNISSDADLTDYLSGHGTHVAGSLAGEALCANVTAQSLVSQWNGMAYRSKLIFTDLGAGTTSSLYPPADLNTQYFPWPYSGGARIHSNSWGSYGNSYTVNARDVDVFMWEHKDFLVVFAVGNFGSSGVEKTVTSPATAKSVLSVGSDQNSQLSAQHRCCLTGYNQCCMEPAAWECTTDCLAVPKSGLQNEQNMAYFSSRGPTSDGRLAPHVIVPGSQIGSAFADDNAATVQCDPDVRSPQAAITFKQGTSMSTPLAAASAALIRQYFREGRYLGKPMIPSAALLKAMMINSAVPVNGTVQPVGSNPMAVGTAPSYLQGYGRVDIGNVLKFADSDFKLHVEDDMSATHQAFQSLCIDVRSFVRRPLVVTLVWTDYPGALTSAIALVNNLDLFVMDASGAIVAGNQELLPPGQLADSLNTAENVKLLTGLPGTSSCSLFFFLSLFCASSFYLSLSDVCLLLSSLSLSLTVLCVPLFVLVLLHGLVTLMLCSLCVCFQDCIESSSKAPQFHKAHNLTPSSSPVRTLPSFPATP
eukprot:TRINITY_DN1458_c0_g1_i2.p1 TRINITY_DN1458_c0_g1~~TRINITY_DN1458_c0_g1_i2.p1  ORF type:complete len:600 (-),score=93.13 TRINITY_DN1458_c0_g1_i2:233-2032(-)